MAEMQRPQVTHSDQWNICILFNCLQRQTLNLTPKAPEIFPTSSGGPFLMWFSAPEDNISRRSGPCSSRN